MIDYNELFKQDAFKSINPEILENFKILVSNMSGKNTNEAFLHIMNFYNSIPKGIKLSKEESETLINTIILYLPQNERKNLLNMLEIINTLAN